MQLLQLLCILAVLQCCLAQTCSYVVHLPGGKIPLVISAPHGGTQTPMEIPDRTTGTTVTDSKTIELSTSLRNGVFDTTGIYPALIYTNLSRIKLDCNRALIESGADNNTLAQDCWNVYQNEIIAAKAQVMSDFGMGLFIDIHGQGQNDYVIIGYDLNPTNLEKTDAALNDPITHYWTTTSILSLVNRLMATNSSFEFSDIIRGSLSIGARLEAKGYSALPGPSKPSPGSDTYFQGGYNTDTHGSELGGTFDGIQFENPQILRTVSAAARNQYAADLAVILVDVVTEFYNFTTDGPTTQPPTTQPPTTQPPTTQPPTTQPPTTQPPTTQPPTTQPPTTQPPTTQPPTTQPPTLAPTTPVPSSPAGFNAKQAGIATGVTVAVVLVIAVVGGIFVHRALAQRDRRRKSELELS